jgi:branched-chain amino acid transport system substrate-binding protein
LAADGGNLVKQLRQLGYKGVIVGGNGFNTANLFPVCGKYCNDIIVAQAYSPQANNSMNKHFAKAYRDQNKKDPPQFAAQAYACVQLVIEALRKVEKTTNKKITQMELSQVRMELNKAIRTGSYMTPLGEISIGKDGELNQKTFYVSQIKMDANGKTGQFVNMK